MSSAYLQNGTKTSKYNFLFFNSFSADGYLDSSK